MQLSEAHQIVIVEVDIDAMSELFQYDSKAILLQFQINRKAISKRVHSDVNMWPRCVLKRCQSYVNVVSELSHSDFKATSKRCQRDPRGISKCFHGDLKTINPNGAKRQWR